MQSRCRVAPRPLISVDLTFMVTLSHVDAHYEIDQLASLKDAKLVSDVLTIKQEVDRGILPDLRDLPLRTCADGPPSSRLTLADAYELRCVPFEQLAEQLQQCACKATRLEPTQSVDEDDPDPEWRALLHAAAECGYAAITQILLLLLPWPPATSVAARSPRGLTAVHAAAVGGNAALLQALIQLEPEAAAAECGSTGWTPMHAAAAAGQVAAIRVLLEAAPETASAVTWRGSTPLHCAARGGHAAAVEVLVDAEPEAATAQNNDDATPLHLAALAGSSEAVQVLLARGPETAAIMGRTDSVAGLPLHVAAAHATSPGHLQVMRLLLAERPSAACAVNEAGWTPLHTAAAFGQLPAVELLLEVAPQTAEALDSSGLTPLLAVLLATAGPCSSPCRRTAVARRLLASGAAPRVLAALRCAADGGMHANAAAAALQLFPHCVAAHLPLSDAEWRQVPAPCPGLGRALPAVLAHSSAQARQLVQRLPAEEAERLRTLALCLARMQLRKQCALPQEIIQRLLTSFDAA